jgi:hypothetical protein
MISIRSVVISGLVVGLAIPVMAQEMRCGEDLISGDQIEPLLSEQVLEKCGEPTKKDGFEWYYAPQEKVLVFNGNDELETIRDSNDE